MAKEIPLNVKYLDSAGVPHDTEDERDGAEHRRAQAQKIIDAFEAGEEWPESDENGIIV